MKNGQMNYCTDLLYGRGLTSHAPVVGRDDSGRPATVTWRIHQMAWEDDATFEETAAFLERNSLTGKIALFTGDCHLPQTLERIRSYLPVLERRISFLKAKGYETGVNHLCTLGHLEENCRDAADIPGAARWTNRDGLTSLCRCPNDPVWREKYLKEVYTGLARTRPDFIWTDDDLRLANHPPARGEGCFCDVCMARLRQRLGYTGGREGLTSFFADSENGESRRKMMLQLNREAIADLLNFIRRTVHTVDPSITIGVMDTPGGWYGLPYEEFYRALSPTGRERVYWRPGGGFYTEERLDVMLGKANALASVAAALPEGVTAVESEIECWNYQYLAKSDAVLTTEALLYIAAGTRGTAWNILPLSPTEDLSVFDWRARRMEALRPQFDALVAAAGRERPRGIWNGEGRDSHAGVNPGGDWFASDPDNDGFLLGSEVQMVGLPVAYREEEAVVCAPSAYAVKAASREELERWLSGGLYLSAGALRAFIARGYGAEVGFVPDGTQDIDVFERNLDHPLNAGFVGKVRDARQSFWKGTATFLRPLTGAQPMTEAVDLRRRPLAPCLSGTFVNRFGGRVFASGYFPYRHLQFSQSCARLKRLFDWLSHGTMPGWVASYHRAAFWMRGENMAVFLNMSVGTAEEVEIVLRGPAWAHGIRAVGVDGASVLQGVHEGDLTRYRLPDIPGWTVRAYCPAQTHGMPKVSDTPKRLNS